MTLHCPWEEYNKPQDLLSLAYAFQHESKRRKKRYRQTFHKLCISLSKTCYASRIADKSNVSKDEDAFKTESKYNSVGARNHCEDIM